MDGRLFSFIAGSLSALFWPALPSTLLLFSLLLLALVLWRVVYLHKLSFLLIGLVWMASVGHWQRHLQLTSEQIQQSVMLEGEVLSLNHLSNNLRFTLKISRIDDHSYLFKRKVRLSWTHPRFAVKQGQKLRLYVKLKPPHGLANEGGFHYQAWLFSEGIVATGYVKDNPANSLLGGNQSLRQRILDNYLSLGLADKPWIPALSFGYRGLLSVQDWHLLQSTGLSHLIAISGLHVGIVAALSYAVCGLMLVLCQRSGLFALFSTRQSINIHLMSLVLSLLCCFAYAQLAGLSLPTLRAWLMLLLWCGLVYFRQNWNVSRVLLLCFSVFIILFPLSIFGLSFWLSFSAVSIITFVFWRWPNRTQGFSVKGFFVGLVRVQLALSALMLPIVAWQFSYISLSSPFINLLAVPIVTLVLVPLCLLATLLLLVHPSVAEPLLVFIASSLDYAVAGLQAIANLPYGANAIHSIPALAWLAAILGSLLIISPRFILPRYLAVLMFLPLLTYFYKADSEEWRVDVLDVGQGLSVLISKNHQAIVYDVGAAYPTGFNMAQAAILPLLQARGINEIDLVILSHDDNDHSGSIKQLSQDIDIKETIRSSDHCRISWQLEWQGLRFTSLWPDDASRYNDNNGSCVVLISDGSTKVLLSGDIHQPIEKKLVRLYGEKLHAQIMVAPHHGSNTSSLQAFIDHVQPDYVVFTQGFMNRWNFPRPEVINRYQQASHLYLSSEHGQVTFSINGATDEPIMVKTYRQHTKPYWYANPF